MARKLFVLNGSNLNMLGLRQPEVYGSATLDDVQRDCERVAGELGFDLFFAQSNAEYEIVEWVHDAFRQQAMVVINPAGFSFRSVPLLDALRMLVTPVVEVHITNIHARDVLYHHSLISSVVSVVIAGAGVYGYELGMRSGRGSDAITEPPDSSPCHSSDRAYATMDRRTEAVPFSGERHGRQPWTACSTRRDIALRTDRSP